MLVNGSTMLCVFLRNRKLQKQALIKSMEFAIKAAFSKYISRYRANPGPIACAAARCICRAPDKPTAGRKRYK